MSCYQFLWIVTLESNESKVIHTAQPCDLRKSGKRWRHESLNQIFYNENGNLPKEYRSDDVTKIYFWNFEILTTWSERAPYNRHASKVSDK